MNICVSQFQASPWATPGDSHILVAPWVGFSLLCLARGSAPGGLKSKQKFDNFEKTPIFAKKQMSSNTFHTFIYARSEQCDLIGSPWPINLSFNRLKMIKSCSFT